MKTIILFLVLAPLTTFANWAQPEVQCPEKILPEGLACPDFHGVRDFLSSFPESMTPEERQEWIQNRAPDLKLCRHQELLRREADRPGSFTPIQVQIAWMVTEGGKNTSKKLAAILKASKAYDVPPHVLLGAFTQESLLASLGISSDGGNFSCGIAQLNIQEWCEGMMELSLEERAKLGWPVLACASIASKFISPFFEIAKRQLASRPEYRLTASDFAGIKLEDVTLPGTPEIQQKRFDAVISFVNHCQDDMLSIQFKATILKKLFTDFVPKSLKKREIYSAGTQFTHSCTSPYMSTYYPLHTGWMLAVAAYNAGPRVAPLVEHYFQITPEHSPALTPKDLIEALYWGGKVNPETKNVVFTGMNGKTFTQSWYKSCVVQRHVARVIQHVTKPGKVLVRSLDTEACSQAVPTDRLNSSGIKI